MKHYYISKALSPADATEDVAVNVTDCKPQPLNELLGMVNVLWNVTDVIFVLFSNNPTYLLHLQVLLLYQHALDHIMII